MNAPEPHRDVAGLHVLTGPADVLAGLDRLDHRDPGAAALGVRPRHHRVGHRRQRRAGGDVDGLRRLQPVRGPGAGLDLADHRQHHRVPSAAIATSTERTA